MSYAPKIVLLLPMSDPDLLPGFVEACLRDRVILIAIVGDDAEALHDVIDDLIVGDGSDASRFITTTFHSDETLEEVLAFARIWERDRARAVEVVRL